MKKQRVQKLITFSPQLATHIEQKAKRLGVTFPEYIRSLAVEDIKDNPNDYIIATPEMEAQIGTALREADAGDVVVFDPTNAEHIKDLFEG